MVEIVTAVGLLIGSVLMLSVCFVFIRHRFFGPGGAALSILGAILIGMSVWSNINVSVGADGGFRAELSQIRDQVAKIDSKNDQLRQTVSTVESQVKETQNVVQSLRNNIAEFQLDEKMPADGIFGPRTDIALRNQLKEMNASITDESIISRVQKITGKSRTDAIDYIREATK